MAAVTSWEGVDERLAKMVSEANLDQAPERRRVREAFKDVQLGIDHCLFKSLVFFYWHGMIVQQFGGMCCPLAAYNPEHALVLKVSFIDCLLITTYITNMFLKGIAKKLASSGYGVFALDYPGFGLSEGLHGYIPSFDTLVNDVAEHFSKIKENSEYQGLPSFLFGQSLGGAVALKCSYNVLAYKDKPRLRTALELLRTTQEIEHRLEEVSLPLIILHGEADIVTDPSVSKALYEKARSSDKKLCLYKDACHSLLEGEPDEMIFKVLNDIVSWLDEHSVRRVPS
ncbi:caffeoylshikimate esterase [Cocos nucifera]|uniref:Caffeoylshikimate esterase n=1 Tax=Cocos nucifera TaxID=13894 RepID=A0A8K0I3I2_COCNU|nr:caffeoylshikimate esterase [Cocos nucifera]